MLLSHFDFFLFRAPTLPIGKFLKANNTSSNLELAQNFKKLFLENPELLTALYISSEIVGKIVENWLKNDKKLENRQLYTIYKYLSRMAVRPTPFGLSAGIGMGKISDNTTEIILGNNSRIHSRINVALLASQFRGTLMALKKPESNLHLNSVLFQHGCYYRYAKQSLNDPTGLDRVKVPINPLLRSVFKKIGKGESYLNLKKHLVEKGLSEPDSGSYIINLLEEQFLVSSLEPFLTGEKYRQMLSEIDFKNFKGVISSNSKNHVSNNHDKTVEYWEKIFSNTGLSFWSEIEVNKQFLPEKANINIRQVEIIVNEIAELIPYSQEIDLTELIEFKKKFVTKYEQREIPLLEALDADVSIGYGNSRDQYKHNNPLLNFMEDKSDPVIQKRNTFSEFITKKLISENTPIELDLINKKDSSLDSIKRKLPPTSFIFGNLLLEESKSTGEKEFYFVLKAWSGPNSNTLMSRFGYMDQSLQQKMRFIAEMESEVYKDYILAEVTFSPAGNEANILQRPDLYTFEIPVLGTSSKNKEFQIPLSDLLISVKNDRVCVRSKRHNKNIMPRISSAHNYKRGNPIYRFFGDLQHQYAPHYINWKWNEVNDSPYLPRVTYKHIILSRARWYIDIQPVREFNDDLLAETIKHYKIANIILIAEGDNELYVDLATPWGRDLLSAKLKKGPVILYEYLNANSGLIHDHNKNNYANEIIIPVKSPAVSFSAPLITAKDQSSTERLFPPGSEWTYLKLYCAPSEADHILRDHLAPIIKRVLSREGVKEWFFVRYSDPDFHLRIRFYHPDESTFLSKITEMFSKKMQALIATNKIWKVQFDTYEREIHRYGKEAMHIIESIAFLNSTLTMKILTTVDLHNQDLLWKIALAIIDKTFSAFSVPLIERINALTNWALSLKKEFNLTKKEIKQLNHQYSMVKGEILMFFKSPNDHHLQQLLCDYGKTLDKVLKKQLPHCRLKASDNIGSIIHMSLNRLFASEQRANEMVIYVYAMHYYKTVFAMEKITKT